MLLPTAPVGTYGSIILFVNTAYIVLETSSGKTPITSKLAAFKEVLKSIVCSLPKTVCAVPTFSPVDLLIEIFTAFLYSPLGINLSSRFLFI